MSIAWRLECHFGVRIIIWFGQRGYGLITLGELQLPKAKMYVGSQKQHHDTQNINAWLEYCVAFDEGPRHVGISIENLPSVLREDDGIYLLSNDEFPF
jgi:hypothetical protein